MAAQCTPDTAAGLRCLRCPSAILSACRCEGSSDAAAARRQWLLAAAPGEAPVPGELCGRYQDIVSTLIAGSVGRPEIWHKYACARLLGLSEQQVNEATGGLVGDLLSCMAEAGLLGPGSPEQAFTAWMRDALSAYDGRFLAAAGRCFRGLTPAEEGSWSEAYDFVQIADPQLGMYRQDTDWAEEEAMLDLVAQIVNRLNPRFVVITGDLVNKSPRSRKGALIAGSQVECFKDSLRCLHASIPLVLQPGNHDIGDRPRPEDIARYQRTFGDDYFSFWVGGVLYINLNSQLYMDGKYTADLREEQDRWLERLVNDAAGKATHIVALSHVPPFIESFDEDEGWSNWPKKHRTRVFEILRSAGVSLWLCGHYHSNADTNAEGVEVVTSSSCGGVINWIGPASEVATAAVPDFAKLVATPPVVIGPEHSGMRLVRVFQDRIEHRWFTLGSVPATFDAAFATEPAAG